ncbi:MAG TPA: Fe2+-dependent dioxygenase [Blastocatellia bacterium]|nr:Fe2+-dependent dioxygenase [Blastocatellia bacterium]
MFISRIDNILGKDALASVRKILETSKFVDGKISGGNARNKNNLELAPESEKYVEVINIIERAVRENVEFNLTSFPRYMTRPIISRYEAGMFYKEHVDLPVMGFMSMGQPMGRWLSPVGQNYVRSDLSMTLFLNDSESYSGGELMFEGVGGATKVKLDAGSAILYPTGSRHSVAPITRGIRYAAILWIQTLFPTEAQRRAVYDARRLLEMVSNIAPQSEAHNLAQESFYNLCRIFAEV